MQPLHNSEEVNANQADNSDDDNIDESGSWEETPSEALDPQESASNFQCVMTEQEKQYVEKNTKSTQGEFCCLICYEDIKRSFQPHCSC